MICETLNNWQKYDFGPVWNEVMAWLEKNAATMDGKTTVAGCEVRYEAGDTKTLDCCLYESHKKTVDIQLLQHGREWAYVAPSEGLPYLNDEYNDAKDVGRHIVPSQEYARLTLTPGVFAVYFPWDAHMPMVAVNNDPEPIIKIIVKIPFDKLDLK